MTGYYPSRVGRQFAAINVLNPVGIPTNFKLLPQVFKKQEPGRMVHRRMYSGSSVLNALEVKLCIIVKYKNTDKCQ